MARHKNINWSIPELTSEGCVPTDNTVIFALLMDLRDELKLMNRTLACPNFLGIPHTLNRIARNTTKRRRRTK